MLFARHQVCVYSLYIFMQIMSHFMRKSAQSDQRLCFFVVHWLDSITPLLAIAEISRLKQVSVAKQAGLSLPGLKPRRQVFS